MNQDHYLTLSGLAKRYGEAPPVVSDLDLVVQRGEFVTLLGPSGCGKTTTLRMVAGLIEPTGGRIRVDGTDITALPAHRRNMGLVFQSYALFPHMTIARNVAFGLEMRGVDKGEIAGRVREALAMVRLEALSERRPRELSGGQQQRVALARALVIRPALLLLDEPLSNLDAKLREELRDEIREIQQKLGITALFVTHDQSEALTMSDRVVVMNAGRIEQTGSPTEIYERPATPFVATFIGRTNQIPLTVESASAAGSVLVGPGGRFVSDRLLAPGHATVAMVRPHRIALAREGAAPTAANAVTATVRKVGFAGETVTYELAAGALTLVVDHHTRTLATGHFQVGDIVVAQWDPADMLAFE